MSRVLIITRTKNRPLLLQRAILSVLNQSYQNWHHIIVNDGGDVEIINDILKPHLINYMGRLEIIHNRMSLGMEAASNLAINFLKLEYVTIHDDDDSWNVNFLEKTISFLKESSYNGVITNFYTIKEKIYNDKIIKINSFKSNFSHIIKIDDILYKNLFPPIAFVYKYSVLEEVGFYDETLSVLGDWDFNLRFIQKYDIFIINEALANYHVRNISSDIYINSILKNYNDHNNNRIILQNKYIRNDILQNKIGIGLLMYFSRIGSVAYLFNIIKNYFINFYRKLFK